MGMTDRESTITHLQIIHTWASFARERNLQFFTEKHLEDIAQWTDDAIGMLKEQEKEIKALRLLVEWAEECDFGFDQFPDEYERYKDEIKDMKYIDGMIHVAKRTLEDHGAYKKGR